MTIEKMPSKGGKTMSHQQILEKAIKLAIKGGWNSPIQAWKVADSGSIDGLSRLSRTRLHIAPEEIIFNHQFAEALWPNIIECDSGYGHHPNNCPKDKSSWRYHIRRMVIAEDPIQYLGEHI